MKIDLSQLSSDEVENIKTQLKTLEQSNRDKRSDYIENQNEYKEMQLIEQNLMKNFQTMVQFCFDVKLNSNILAEILNDIQNYGESNESLSRRDFIDIMWQNSNLRWENVKGDVNNLDLVNSLKKYHKLSKKLQTKINKFDGVIYAV